MRRSRRAGRAALVGLVVVPVPQKGPWALRSLPVSIELIQQVALGACSGRRGRVAEQFEEVVGGGDQAPLGLDRGQAAAGKAADLAGVFGVREDRFDKFGAAAVERSAGLGVQQRLDALGLGALQARPPAAPGGGAWGGGAGQ